MSSWLFETFSVSPKEALSVALETNKDSITYQRLSNLIDARAKELKKEGLFPGARVAFIASSDLATIILFFALLSLKVSPCPLSHRIPKESLPSFFKRARTSFFIDDKSSLPQKISSHAPLPPFILLFTSGSSGSPKLVCLELINFLESAQGSIPSLDLLKKPGKWLLSVPLFHVSGLSILFRCLLSKSIISLDPLSSSLTHLSLVPTQLIRLLSNNKKYPLLRCILLGGAPISKELLQNHNLPIKTTYGLTETASQVTMSLSEESLFPGHLGKVLPGRELKVDSTGEILVRGKTLFAGYDKGSTPSLPLTQDGWFATGDLGALTPEGNLLYKGRKDNLFISGGENIYPEEIEQVLNTLPNVLSSVVIPIDDREFGKRPIAFLHMSSSLPQKEELQEALLSRLPKFCIPTNFFPFPEDLRIDLKVNREKFRNLIFSLPT